MPSTIISDAVAAPYFNLTEHEVEQCLPELETYLDEFKAGFSRRDQFERFRMYVTGLLSDLARKTIEGIALAFGGNVRDLQHFAGQSPWETEPLVSLHQQQVGTTLGKRTEWSCWTNRGWSNKGTPRLGLAHNTAVPSAKLPTRKMGSIWAM